MQTKGIPFLQIFWRSKFFLYKKLRRYLWICSYLKIKSLVPKKKLKGKKRKMTETCHQSWSPKTARQVELPRLWFGPIPQPATWSSLQPLLVFCPAPDLRWQDVVRCFFLAQFQWGFKTSERCNRVWDPPHPKSEARGGKGAEGSLYEAEHVSFGACGPGGWFILCFSNYLFSAKLCTKRWV